MLVAGVYYLHFVFFTRYSDLIYFFYCVFEEALDAISWLCYVRFKQRAHFFKDDVYVIDSEAQDIPS